MCVYFSVNVYIAPSKQRKHPYKMKASQHFVDQLTTGVRVLADKHGADMVATSSPWSIFFAISAALCQGQRHHVDMDEDPVFRAERWTLKDNHIATATKAAIRKALSATA